jgi:hypothetical protein
VIQVEIRLIGTPENVDAVVAALQQASGVRLTPRGRQDSRSGPGKVVQYGRISPVVPPPVGEQGGATP